MTKIRPERAHFVHFTEITTRWMDNDAYGHVNNVVYYSWFDTCVNRFLIEAGVLDPIMSSEIGLVAETGCSFFASVAFPEPIEVGLRVAHLGRTSVRYEMGLFKRGERAACASGHFVHVYVNRDTRLPTPISVAMRDILQPLIHANEFPPATS